MIKAKKELGQNFMSDPTTISLMIDALGLDNDEVLEIGPGLGAFTKAIALKLGEKGSLRAVEFDHRLINELKQKFASKPNVNIHYANILDFLPSYTPKTGKYKVFGSLPYYITSPILHAVIKGEVLPDVCVFMVQFEVAEKVASTVPDSSYLSSFVQSFYDVELIQKVDRKLFDPVPNVDGGVLKMVLKPESVISKEEILSFEKFLHHAYSNPRKMLNKVFEPTLLEGLGISANLRPQNIDVETWYRIFRAKKSK